MRALILVLLLAGLAAVLFVANPASMAQREFPPAPKVISPPGPPIVPRVKAKAKRIDFLADLDLSGAAGDTMLVFHDLATGNGMRAVTDQALIRSHAETAYFTNDPDALSRMPFGTLLFTAMSNQPVDPAFVTILQGGKVVARHECYPRHCLQSPGADTPPHSRDIADLLAASHPVSFQGQSLFATQLRAALAEIAADPARFVLDIPALPAPGTPAFEGYATLTLPLIIRPDPGPADYAEFPLADLLAQVSEAFDAVLPGRGREYALVSIHKATAMGPQPVMDLTTARQVEANDTSLVLDGFEFIEPVITVQGDRAFIEALRTGDILARLPDLAQGEPLVQAALAQLLAREIGRPCPGGCDVMVPLAAVPVPTLGPFRPTEYYLTTYTIADQ